MPKPTFLTSARNKISNLLRVTDNILHTIFAGSLAFISSEEFPKNLTGLNFHGHFISLGCCLVSLAYFFTSRKQVSSGQIMKTSLKNRLLYYCCLKNAFHRNFH